MSLCCGRNKSLGSGPLVAYRHAMIGARVCGVSSIVIMRRNSVSIAPLYCNKVLAEHACPKCRERRRKSNVEMVIEQCLAPRKSIWLVRQSQHTMSSLILRSPSLKGSQAVTGGACGRRSRSQPLLRRPGPVPVV